MEELCIFHILPLYSISPCPKFHKIIKRFILWDIFPINFFISLNKIKLLPYSANEYLILTAEKPIF